MSNKLKTLTALAIDGADVLSGADFNDVIGALGGSDAIVIEVDGSDTAADFFAIAADGGRVDFARTSFGQFTLDVSTSAGPNMELPMDEWASWGGHG